MTRVNVGDLWEFVNTEGHWPRYALVYILEIIKQDENPKDDHFKYLTIKNDSTDRAYIETSHLTIRRENFAYCWEKLG